MTYPAWFNPNYFDMAPPTRPEIMITHEESLGSIDSYEPIEIQEFLNRYPTATHIRLDGGECFEFYRSWQEPNPNYEEEIVAFLRENQAYRLKKDEWTRLKQRWDDEHAAAIEKEELALLARLTEKYSNRED